MFRFERFHGFGRVLRIVIPKQHGETIYARFEDGNGRNLWFQVADY